MEKLEYTGTVNVWTDDGIINSGVQEAWDALQAVPPYVERYRDAQSVVIEGSCIPRHDWTEEERLAAMERGCGLQLIG